ncbi:hypothetical protein HYW20_06560 [Candidatus Woesearchaeota archaeon]|nr:hypothetical protein [Candidatus Woesearchaeota archaeon]
MRGIEDIQKLFYDPSSESIDLVVKEILGLHSMIQRKTDPQKGTLPIEKFDYQSAVEREPIADSIDFSLEELADVFDGAVRWHSPLVMYNVTPPPLLSAVSTAALTQLYNSNIAWDIAAGKVPLIEQKIIRYFAERFGWDWKDAGGSFVFGGKGTNLYGIKTAVNSIADTSNGMPHDIVVFSTKACHPSHIQDCEWLGIGKNKCVRIDSFSDGTINLEDFATQFRNYSKNSRIACIMISGGTTMDVVVDHIDEVIGLRDRLVQETGLSYTPKVHVDSVLGWAWSFFKDYDFENNPLNIDGGALKDVRQISDRLAKLTLADTLGIDFHKTGFAPYSSSLFLIKDKKRLYGATEISEYGKHTPFKYTIENSRAATGVMSAYVSLRLLRPEGFRVLFGHLTEMKRDLQSRLEESGQFEIINSQSLGTSVVFVPKSDDSSMVARVIDVLRQDGNPYFIDMIPAYSTGSHTINHPALKAYIMSPFSSRDVNADFVRSLCKIKDYCEIRVGTAGQPFSEHPLKA